MDNIRAYDAGIEDSEGITCAKCGSALVLSPVTFSYLGHAFPVELPACPRCRLVYVPETLAKGKVLHVEQSLEEK